MSEAGQTAQGCGVEGCKVGCGAGDGVESTQVDELFGEKGEEEGG